MKVSKQTPTGFLISMDDSLVKNSLPIALDFGDSFASRISNLDITHVSSSESFAANDITIQFADDSSIDPAGCNCDGAKGVELGDLYFT